MTNNFCDGLISITSEKYVQEIKKTGVIALLLPGVQMSSLVVLHNEVLAKNLYSFSRFWSQFIYFDVPKWEENSNQTKYIVSQDVNSIITHKSRLLQSSTIHTIH